MERRIAKFEKVSLKQFERDLLKFPNIDEFLIESGSIRKLYDSLKLPKRATKGSAGYDLYLPIDISIPPHSSLTIPTGVKCNINNDYVLLVLPRSGHGFKYGIRLQNTCGVIDSDYYDSDNEGHIMVKLYNPNNDEFELEKGTAFCQGLFFPYGITMDDNVTENRNGGFGSTDKK